MTNEQLLKGNQIQNDLRALQEQTINKGISTELFTSWKKWNIEMQETLKREFEKL